MKKYIEPTYEKEGIEAEDVILTSIMNAGVSTVGSITGQKGAVEVTFANLLGNQ